MLIEMTLDIEKGENRFSTLDNPITLRQQDGGAYVFDVSLRQGGQVLDLTGMTVRFYARRPDGSKVIDGDGVSVQSASDGLVQYTVPKELTQSPGDLPTSYFRITSGDWDASTGNVAIRVIPSVAFDATADGDYVPEIDALLNAMEAQRVSYASAEDTRVSDWDAIKQDANEVTGKANGAADAANDASTTALASASDAADEAKAASYAAAAARAAAVAAMEACDCPDGTADGLAMSMAAFGWLFIDGAIYGPTSKAAFSEDTMALYGVSVDGSTITLAELDAAGSVSSRLKMLEDRADGAEALAQKAWDARCRCEDREPAIQSLAQQVAYLSGGWFFMDGTAFGAPSKASYSSSAISLSGATSSGTTVTLS